MVILALRSLFLSFLFLTNLHAVPQKQWKTNFLGTYPKLACRGNGHWARCYGLPHQECETKMEQALKTCFNFIKIPADINLAGDGPLLGSLVAECGAKNFAHRWTKFRKEERECL
jgi:hypothetical protein